MDSVTETGDGKSKSGGTTRDVETPEPETVAPLTSGKVPISSAGSDKFGVFFDPEGITPYVEGIATALAPGSPSDVPDKRHAALHAN